MNAAAKLQITLGFAACTIGMTVQATSQEIVLQNSTIRMEADARGHVTALLDRARGVSIAGAAGQLGQLTTKSGPVLPLHAIYRQGVLELDYGSHGTVSIRVKTKGSAITFQVKQARLTDADRLVLFDIPLTLKGIPAEPTSACALALNLQTNVEEVPRATNQLKAYAISKFGFAGAAASIVVSKTKQFHGALQAAVLDAPELPHSSIGGPFALGKAINSGSYLFNFGGMTEQNVGEWIALAQRAGLNQIDFHGGSSFRFGDCVPNPQTYPAGRASFKRVIDKLHAAGIKAGLHTYAFFMDKKCKWVTPVPDKRLAYDSEFTLADDLDAASTTVPVLETTANMNAITGFFVFNSITLMVDDELINYSGVQKDGKFAFTNCTRGAFGTHVAAHKKGANLRHLKECFGLFVPDPNTTLFAEVAGSTASMFNECGFDMIYLDALDGEGILGGNDLAWHYGSQFVWEINKRLRKSALMEMSTFHHHLWYVRSRMGAWDHPTRSHKQFIDIHCKANEECARMFLPGQLGWWSIRTWTGASGEPTYSDDMEYLLCKCLGTGNGLALMGIDPTMMQKVPALPRYADLIKRYEDLRHSGKVPTSMREKLAQPNSEFTLTGDLKAGWSFSPVSTAKIWPDQFTQSDDKWVSDTTVVNNPTKTGHYRLRIEALQQAGEAGPAADRISLADPASGEVTLAQAAPGITARISAAGTLTPGGEAVATIQAENSSATRTGSWVQFKRVFSEVRNLKGREGLGVWVKGDGSGALLNLQLRCPSHVVAGIGEHYVTLDFTGWRWVELVEPEGRRWAEYSWPYGDPYSIYRESTEYGQIGEFSMWLNNLSKGSTEIQIGSVYAMPLQNLSLKNPTVIIGGVTLRFPCEVPAGGCVEYDGGTTAVVYSGTGAVLTNLQGIQAVPIGAGQTRVRVSAASNGRARPRLRVSIGFIGEPLHP